MSTRPSILVATDQVTDAVLIKKLLQDEFGNIQMTSDPDQSVADFERCRPAVLILAFHSLEKAERYYLGLYRLSTLVHALPHRTLILCSKDDLRRVYELCKKDHFDDYILFWPMAQDALRLPMAVHHALQHAAGSAGDMPTPAEFAAQARRIAGLEAMLEQGLNHGGVRIKAASDSLQRAETEIGAAMDDFSRSFAAGAHANLVDIRDPTGLQHEFDRLKTNQLAKSLQSARASAQPMHQWINEFRDELAPQMESARKLQLLSTRVRRSVMIVEDDGFQQGLLKRLLADENLHLSFATTGLEALAMLRKRRPELVLMDVNLPDISGIEVTRRLKAIPEFTGTPVIMITGHSGKQMVIESLQAGASDFLVKPFEKDILVTKVRKFLELSSTDESD